MNGAGRFILMLCLTGCVGMFAIMHEAYAGEVVIIANKDAPTDNLDQDAIKKIFLGNIINWENNEVIMVVLSGDKEIHDAFLKKYIKRTSSQFQNVWRQNLFTGKGAMSKTLKDSNAVVDYISNTQGSIGYVSSETSLPDAVKIVDK
ncbi:MAG: substrate-binding domain-containing protein [Proteobacteria bacterium]|nr:substrate-binding domain-containing protein [Pseudomonadota bacterium]